MLSEGSLTCKSSGWLPVTLASLMTVGIGVAYVWAVVRKDVEAWIPYISEAGGNPPQSGVFAIFLYLSATVGLVTMSVRFTSLHRQCREENRQFRFRFLNYAGLALGLACVVGMLMVGSYPVLSERIPKNCDNSTKNANSATVLLPHTLGAMFIFVIGIVFAFAQGLLSLFLRPPISPCSIFRDRPWHLFTLRTFLCLLAFASLLVMSIIKDDRDKTGSVWVSTDTSRTKVAAEWVLALMLVLLFLSLYPEMKMVGLEVKTVTSHPTLTETGGTERNSTHSTDSLGSTSRIVSSTHDKVVYT